MIAVLASRALAADDVAVHLAGTLAAVAILLGVATLVYMAWPVRRPNPPRPASRRLTGAAAIRANTVYPITTLAPRRPGGPTVILRPRRGGRHV